MSIEIIKEENATLETTETETENKNDVSNLSVGEVHDVLNPVLWDEQSKLWPEVKQHILDIVEEFRTNLDVELDVVDIQLVGSNASFNYNEHSDIDVHIVANFNDMGTPEAIVQQAMNATKAQFNKDYDIKFRGLDVEIYVENINSATMSNGIYSVMRDKWIKYPHKIKVPNVELEPELSDIRSEVNAALISKDAGQIKTMINKLHLMRQDSLAVNGEFGKGNLIFKQIRNDGLLDGLKNKLKEVRSDELSIESVNESLGENKMSTWSGTLVVGVKDWSDFAHFAQDMADLVTEALANNQISCEPIDIFKMRHVEVNDPGYTYWSIPVELSYADFDVGDLCFAVTSAIDSFDTSTFTDDDEIGELRCDSVTSNA